MSIIVAGVDPSISGTAVCSGAANSQRYNCRRYPGGELRESTYAATIDRYNNIAGRVMQQLEPIKPALILIEGYATGIGKQGKTRSITQLCELGGILGLNLTDLTHHVYQVAQSTRLKFLTGCGKAPKGEAKTTVAKAIWNNYQVSFDNDDMADAFAYWQIAKAAFADPTTLKPYQLESLDTVFGAQLRAVRALAQGVTDDSCNGDEEATSGPAAF
jgi:Holliday junction resolvasome RuvABC endonuclease subunit